MFFGIEAKEFERIAQRPHRMLLADGSRHVLHMSIGYTPTTVITSQSRNPIKRLNLETEIARINAAFKNPASHRRSATRLLPNAFRPVHSTFRQCFDHKLFHQPRHSGRQRFSRKRAPVRKRENAPRAQLPQEIPPCFCAQVIHYRKI